MYIKYKETNYPCTCKPSSTMTYHGLPNDFPAPVDGVIELFADDGFLIRTDNTVDYLRQTFENGVLTLTNVPEPEPVEPEPEIEPVPTEADDTAAMLIDHEYRLTLLELGLTEY